MQDSVVKSCVAAHWHKGSTCSPAKLQGEAMREFVSAILSKTLPFVEKLSQGLKQIIAQPENEVELEKLLAGISSTVQDFSGTCMRLQAFIDWLNLYQSIMGVRKSE